MDEKWFWIFLISITIILIVSIIWGLQVVPKQMEFSKQCEEKCLEKGMDYKTEFQSIPFGALNGKCYCVFESKEVSK